jgi:hypothetical protein
MSKLNKKIEELLEKVTKQDKIINETQSKNANRSKEEELL